MKFNPLASSILFIACIFLSGCGQFGLPDVTRHDEVPDDIKAQPRLVESPPPPTDAQPWPRLGDVPFKPNNFSTKPVYDHYMNELEYQRAEAQDSKQKVEAATPAIATTAAAPTSPAATPLLPPQLPKD